MGSKLIRTMSRLRSLKQEESLLWPVLRFLGPKAEMVESPLLELNQPQDKKMWVDTISKWWMRRDPGKWDKMRKIKMTKALWIKFHMMMAKIWKVKSSMTQIRCKIKFHMMMDTISPLKDMQLEGLKSHKLFLREILRSMHSIHLTLLKR